MTEARKLPNSTFAIHPKDHETFKELLKIAEAFAVDAPTPQLRQDFLRAKQNLEKTLETEAGRDAVGLAFSVTFALAGTAFGQKFVQQANHELGRLQADGDMIR